MAIGITEVIQVIIAAGLLNVWVLRSKRSTDYRGGDAKNIVEEFATYGLSTKCCYAIGFLKVTSAVLLIAGLWLPGLVLPAAGLITVLMAGAISMHIKVKDPLKKSLPAIAMLIMSLIVCLSNY